MAVDVYYFSGLGDIDVNDFRQFQIDTSTWLCRLEYTTESGSFIIIICETCSVHRIQLWIDSIEFGLSYDLMKKSFGLWGFWE